MSLKRWLLLGFPVWAIAVGAAATQPAGWQAGLMLGTESHDVTTDIQQGDVVLNFDPEDSGDVWGAQLGYLFGNGVSVSLDFLQADADDTEVQNIYFSANYSMPLGESKASLSLGVLAGYSELEWQEYPVASLEASPQSDKWFGGVQLGLDYRFNSSLSGFVAYQYHGTDHQTNISLPSGSIQLNHDNYQYLQLGLRYHWE